MFSSSFFFFFNLITVIANLIAFNFIFWAQAMDNSESIWGHREPTCDSAAYSPLKAGVIVRQYAPQSLARGSFCCPQCHYDVLNSQLYLLAFILFREVKALFQELLKKRKEKLRPCLALFF